VAACPTCGSTKVHFIATRRIWRCNEQHQRRQFSVKVGTIKCENFWSLLRRTIRGTYVSIEPFHVFRYLDEQAYRFNNRKKTDRERFVLAAGSIIGKRLTYRTLTGHDLLESCPH
jgi:hypothetical protein